VPVVAAGIVADPLPAVVDVRRIGMAGLVTVVAPLIALIAVISPLIALVAVVSPLIALSRDFAILLRPGLLLVLLDFAALLRVFPAWLRPGLFLVRGAAIRFRSALRRRTRRVASFMLFSMILLRKRRGGHR
jgi:hypothetical protein